MSEKDLQKHWLALVSNHTADHSLINDSWKEIESRYNERKRFYHNLEHIGDMLQQAEALHTQLEQPDILYFAIWYHDIIYKITKRNNELKSARLAVKRLKQFGISEELQHRCFELILATKSHQVTDNTLGQDLHWMIDFDLSILGRPWEEYFTYTQKIRKEYWLYPDIVYKPGRRKALKHFLSAQQIYKTEEYFLNLEEQARLNLERELIDLS